MGESPITLGKLIKSARLEAGLTQDNLATRVGVTSRYIMAIENLRGNRGLGQLFSMSKQLLIRCFMSSGPVLGLQFCGMRDGIS